MPRKTSKRSKKVQRELKNEKIMEQGNDSQIMDDKPMDINNQSEDKVIDDKTVEAEDVVDNDVTEESDDSTKVENQEEDEFEENKEELSTNQEVTPTGHDSRAKPFWSYDSSSSDDDAPEEVGNTSNKQHTLEMYELRKQAALATKRRKRKQRVQKVEETLDESTLQLLSNNAELLASTTTQADEEPKSKVIHLTSEDLNPTQTVEKQVDNFRIVALSKDTSTSVGKPINSDILSFQRSHFYGAKSNRVDSGSYVRKLSVRNRH